MSLARGYTLLEMMVVVALLALATGMVAPAGYRMIASWREADEVEQVIHALAALPLRARNDGRTLQLAAGDAAAVARVVPLPEGWRLVLGTPLTVRANGACSGADGVLETERQALALRIEAPFCRVHRVPAGGG
ncbi:MAG TPA: type II secretion system protein [Pseudoxanthomonas sp.]|nr:type II secretion system protein [Pseudoxanthomonas sp.]